MFGKCKDLIKKVLPSAVYGALRDGLLRCLSYVKLVVRLCLFPFAWLYLWILNLRQPTRISLLITSRIGHLALNTDLFLRNKEKSGIKEHIILLACKPVANDFLLQRWSDIAKVLKLWEYPIYGRFLVTLMVFNSKYYFELPYEGNEYETHHHSKTLFYFTDSEVQDGDRILEEMGIGKNDWFVCVFARDSSYLDAISKHNRQDKESPWAYHDYRDSDIDSLNLAIDEILARGGFVIRLGKVVAKAMSYKHKRVIDYPLSKWRSDFMDIYLQYKAKFVLSSSASGATDVCSLFDTPYCGVNTPAYWNMPYKNTIQIPKTYRYKSSGKMVGLKEWIRLVKSKNAHHLYGCDYRDSAQLSVWHSDFYSVNDLEILNNTPEEILDLTKEMFERLDGSFKQNDEDKKRQEKYFAINANYLPVKDCKNPYGREFLAKNEWFLDEAGE